MPDQPANLKKVLFVDDNLQFLEMIERLMGNWSRGEWQIFLAQNSGKALLILQEHSIDLAVVDVQMPVVDGIQFLALLNRKYPTVQKVTLSAYADEASRTACLSQGAELFLEKPRDPADLEIIFATLRELARHKPVATGFRGVLRQVSLEDVIQMECLNRNSSILEVKGSQWTGQIFIKDGTILHAEAGDRNGESALNRILSLKGGEFNLKPFVDPPRQSIDGPWEFLLMEAARVRDEGSEAETPEPPVARAEMLVDPNVPSLPVPAPPVRASDLVPPADVFLPPPVGNRPIRVDEMVVCTAKGEVVYEWQSPTIGDRISFLEFLSQKSLQLGEGLNLGAFDRLEMESERTRVIAQIKTDRGVFFRATRGTNRRVTDTPRTSRMKEHVHNWLTEKMRVAGMLGCGIRSPDRKTFIRSASPQFTPVALEHACRCLSDTFQVISSNRFPTQLVRWIYENYFVYGFIREDGHCLALLTRRHEGSLHSEDLETIVAEFHSLPL